MRKILFVCESPWDDGTRLVDWSMRPFVEGLAELCGAALHYRTFTTATELHSLVEHNMPDPKRNRVIVYISAHGQGGKLSAGFRGQESVTLAPLAGRIRKGVEGIWLGACEVGGAESLRSFDATWAGGYRSAVAWDSAMLTDLAVLRAALRSGPIKSRDGAVKLFRRALAPLNARAVIGSWDKTTRGRSRAAPASLADSLRVVALKADVTPLVIPSL